MKRVLLIIFTMCIATLFLMGCSNTDTKNYDYDTAKAKVEELNIAYENWLTSRNINDRNKVLKLLNVKVRAFEQMMKDAQTDEKTILYALYKAQSDTYLQIMRNHINDLSQNFVDEIKDAKKEIQKEYEKEKKREDKMTPAEKAVLKSIESSGLVDVK